MNKIKSIKKAKNDTYLIEIETKKGLIPHLITENTIVKYHLTIDQELTKADYNQIIKHNEYETLYLKAIQYISYQMRTISEVKKHLQKSTKSETVINQIIEELKQHKYVNDKLFTKEYVLEKIEYDNVGPKYIREKLIQKGIHFDLIEESLRSFTDDMQFDKVFQLIQKELRYKQKKPYQKVYLSLKQKLISKGFSLSIIESSITSLKEEIMAQIDEMDLLQKEFHKLRKNVDLSDKEARNKLIQKLLRKGYHYERITKVIDQEDGYDI
jgi:regulatory protein